MTEAAINEAAAQLRDDPSFRLFPAEQAKEATEALKRAGHPEPDDGLAVALVIEAALTGSPSVAPSADRADDVCGQTVTNGEPNGKPPCTSPQLAANGRCMGCGARRALPKVEEPVAAPEPAQAAPPAVEPAPAATPPATTPAGPSNLGPEILDQLVKVGGFTQAELAKVLECSRQSVGFYCSGKVAWEPGPQTLARLGAEIQKRQAALTALAAVLQ